MSGVTQAPPGTSETKPPSLSTLQGILINRGLLADQPGGSGGTGHAILDRMHPVLRARYDQLQINLLSVEGGRPYVEARLSRYAGENKISWEGGSRKDGTTVTGRLAQAHCVPYPGRITDKINQYVFSEPAKRPNGDPVFLDSVNREGLSAHFFLRELNSLLTSCRWAWVGVDMPRVTREISVQEKEDKQIRPYWVLYSPLEVVDWCFDELGGVKWVLTETEEFNNDDPMAEATVRKVRSLWEKGRKTNYWFDEASKTLKSEVIQLGLKTKVPLFPVGTISARPHLFDSIESINRTILDLESVSRQNYFDRCFPQMYLPASVLNAMAEVLKGYSAEQMMEMVIGMNFPILLEEGDQIPGYVMPASGDLKAPDEKVKQLKSDMFECVGMMLRTESRAAQSGEAKSWDHLDVEQVLKDRANLLFSAEKKAIALSKLWDPTFKEYVPEYPQSFNVRDYVADMNAVLSLAQVPLPGEMAKEVYGKLLELLSKIGVKEIPVERVEELKASIEEFVDQQNTQLEQVAGGEEQLPPGEPPPTEEPV